EPVWHSSTVCYPLTDICNISHAERAGGHAERAGGHAERAGTRSGRRALGVSQCARTAFGARPQSCGIG
ncbi:hypothetical protein ACFXPA_27950, partial [Amycolatopsis sp. NPDC059090]|uniref:hypothetical protein n=1 Tax=Amycolatopsis sp. NPDC059090 TaxID=3346723 RepID=UPI00366AE931